MKFRKNEIISPKSFVIPRWKMKNLYGAMFDFLRRDLDESLLYYASTLSCLRGVTPWGRGDGA